MLYLCFYCYRDHRDLHVQTHSFPTRRSSDLLTMNPLLILVSLSFWGWVWGTPGALLAVPLLIILQTVIAAAGKPDIAGFLFEHGTLMHSRREEFADNLRKSEQDG